MSDLLEDGSFMFTSESVGEGHPGESAIAKVSSSYSMQCLAHFLEWGKEMHDLIYKTE